MASSEIPSEKEVSATAILLGNLFNEEDDGLKFFDLTIARFEQFDESNRVDDEDRTFCNDINYIFQCTMKSFTGRTFDQYANRIDSYFYIYRRFQEYITMKKNLLLNKEPSTLINLEIFRQKFYELLAKIFISSKGTRPNLCLNDPDLLKRINILEHLSFIKTIDKPTLILFFVLCKLSLQSSLSNERLKWTDIFSKIENIKLPLLYFIDQYLDYSKAFEQFPLDTQGYIHLIQRIHPFKQTNISPFDTYTSHIRKLSFQATEFFELFQPIFRKGIKDKLYELEHISQLFKIFRTKEHFFAKYFYIYYSDVNNDDLWAMFLNLCTISDINEIIRKYFTPILITRISIIQVETFHKYIQSARECFDKLKSEDRPRFIDIFEKLYDSFIITQIPNPQYSYRFKQTDLKELLKIGLLLTSTKSLKRPSCLLLFREISFKIDSRIKHAGQKIKYLFENFDTLDENLYKNDNPSDIIEDDWLKDFVLTNLQSWSTLDYDTYQYLSDYHHQNNPWIIYIWTRIIHLSILKLINTNSNDTLLKLNQWMKNIKREEYDSTDSLTIIFIAKLFEIIIVKYIKSILSLPDIDIIMKFILTIRMKQPNQIDAEQVDVMTQNSTKIIQEILQLKSPCILYHDLLKGTILYSFLTDFDIKRFLKPALYKFPKTTPVIDSIVSLSKPKDIDTQNFLSNQDFFSQFLQQMDHWLEWFDRFIIIFQYILEWLKNSNVNRANQLYQDLNLIRTNPKVTLIQQKDFVGNLLKLLESISDLKLLCHLFNCSTLFQINDFGTLNYQTNTTEYLKNLRNFQPNSTFTIENQCTYEHTVHIKERQQVEWSLASENYSCHIQIQYQTNDPGEMLYDKENVEIHKHVLSGRFETQRSGQLIIKMTNKQSNNKTCKIWYRIKSFPISTCHLFNGIYHMFYKNFLKENIRTIDQNELNQLLNQVFLFIDKLLNGDLNLKDMKELTEIFYDKNIHIKEEVKKLYRNSTNDYQIEQVCEWLQIYQYYSHIDIIVKSIEKFQILSSNNQDQILNRLKELTQNDNCSLREITQAHKILQQYFQNLTHQHLQLIKTVVECSNVIDMMKKSDLYTNHGRQRFQQLRDNLTTQFQFQEKNNMVLNSWIITYTLIEPFMFQATNFDEFISRLVQLTNLDETSLNHIRIVNDNMQIVNMWLSPENTTILDNALITMEYLYKTGKVDIYLQHLINEESYFEIEYSIGQTQGHTMKNIENEIRQQEIEKNKFHLSMNELDDHKRQLTFCNADVEKKISARKLVINGQLELLKTIDNIYSILTKLELAGHPNYQLRDIPYEIHLQYNYSNAVLTELGDYQHTPLGSAIKTRTESLKLIANTLQTSYDIWIKALKDYRNDCSLLKLFSNRQIMFLIILLRVSRREENSIRNRFLKKLFSFKDLNNQKDEQEKLVLHCLLHYLRSLRINQCDLSYQKLSDLYTKYQIDPDLDIELNLKKLSQFLKELFHNEQELFQNNQIGNNKEQYLVIVNPKQQTDESITFEHDFDMDTCCILLNIFNNRLPSVYQILWCSNVTEEDIHLFFSRIRTFHSLTFVLMDIDKMHHRLREILLHEQDLLTRENNGHGTVYYFSRELTVIRKDLREFPIPKEYRDPKKTYTQLIRLFQQQQQLRLPKIQIVYGAAGSGKTHRINKQYKDETLSCFSINDKLNLSLLIRSFLLFDSNPGNENPLVYFNISLHAPFEELNRTFLSLFICGSLIDDTSGLTFSLPITTNSWKFVIEIPYSDITRLKIKENFDQILPLLSVIISPSNLEEITDDNYQLFIGDEEELVARFLKAYDNGTIDRLYDNRKPIKFDPLTNPDECRKYIYNCINKYASELPNNKIYELSFTKFLYRRIQFFLKAHYIYNERYTQLGSIAMKQMINEAKSLTQISFKYNNYPRVYLVYDAGFSLRLLHLDWNHVSDDIKSIFDNQDPIKSIDYEKKNYFGECLAWLIGIRYGSFDDALKKEKFILTENFAYKLFHVHERKLTRLPLIIEGDTGVGKTFLLRFYSVLLNVKNTKKTSENKIMPRFIENSSAFLLNILTDTVEKQANFLNTFILQIKQKFIDMKDDDIIKENFQMIDQQENGLTDVEFLEKIKLYLKDAKNDNNKKVFYYIWESILTASNETAMNITPTLIQSLHDYITTELTTYPLIDASLRLKSLLQETLSPSSDISIEIFKEYLFHSQIKPLFYRLLLHPGITEEQLVQFMEPITQLARELSNIEIVVFFDEVNTSSCLGLFKEMFMDGTLHGKIIPKNIFFTAAINPLIMSQSNEQIHRSDYLVHELPQSLKHLKVSYGALEPNTLAMYIIKKIEMFQDAKANTNGQAISLDRYFQDKFADSILKAQSFCEKRLGHNSVSQREIQRCFNLIEFFSKTSYDNGMNPNDQSNHSNADRCIVLSLALIYYFRLPTQEDNSQRNDQKTPSREEFADVFSETIPDFEQIIQDELVKFVNTDNFIIPKGVAVNQAVREHIFAIVVSIDTRTPLCIIGVPGQSKTLSFQIVVQNLQGRQLSTTEFCKRLPAIDPFFCLGSKYTRSDDIAYNFDRAIKREQHYIQNGINTRCVVFLDEASLPDEKKMVLKVLHPYLDECKVAFVAVANKSFDAANANRMICVYRSLPSKDDQQILAYGCLGLQKLIDKNHESIVYGLCQGYRRILQSTDISQIFHDRDFIYMLRELRFELGNLDNKTQEKAIGEIKPKSLLHALEDNFNGIKPEEFEKLIHIFFAAVNECCPNFELSLTEKQENQRSIPTILRDSLKLDSLHRRLYGRYKLIIDESDDESAICLLFQTGILDSDSNQINVIRMSDFSNDINNELRNAEMLSTIKLHMETGNTILMVNTNRIHGSLYDVFNQNFSIMATDESRKIFSKVAIGPKTIDVAVHENFQCIIHIKRSEFQSIPAPFLSRFQKFSLSVIDFYQIYLNQLIEDEQILVRYIEKTILSFIEHFGEQYFYGLNKNTLYSCLLTLIKKDHNEQYSLIDIQQNYSQLIIKSKSFIEQDFKNNRKQTFVFYIITKLLQIVSPESILYKLPTFNQNLAQLIHKNYFIQQEHFNIENFIQRLISPPDINIENNYLLGIGDNLNDIFITTKVMLFTRTSSFVLGLNKDSKNDVFKKNKDNEYPNISEKISVLNLITIENSSQLEDKFTDYKKDQDKKVLLIVIDGRINQQCLHIPYVRQLIDKTDQSCRHTNQTPQKFFILLIHSSGQEFNRTSCFSSIFLHDWDYHYIDSCTPGSSFHLEKMLQTFTSSFGQESNRNDKELFDYTLCDFDTLFDDCLWDFCSRIQIYLHKFPREMFKNQQAYEFYRPETKTNKRVQCLKELLHYAKELQKRIIKNYHENILMNKNSLVKNCHFIYRISKDILSGKRLTSLVDCLQSEIRISFTNFVSNFLKFIVNDYGLESLEKLSTTTTINNDESLLNLIDYSTFSTNDNNDNDDQYTSINPSNFSLRLNFFIPQTPLYNLFHERIKSLADHIKSLLVHKQKQEIDDDYFTNPPTTIFNNYNGNNETRNSTSEQFQTKLITSLKNDKILSKVVSPPIVESYTNDSIQRICTTISTNFNKNPKQSQNIIEFISKWLLHLDENEKTSFDLSINKNLWLIAHVYTLLEYEQNDIFSLYSACCIIKSIDSTQLFDKEDLTRSTIRENLFRLLFDSLWKSLLDICLGDDSNLQQWINNYTFIFKYYPSEKVLDRFQFTQIRVRIEFMNLAYLIFLNEKLFQAKTILLKLLEETSLIQDNSSFNITTCLKYLPIILKIIQEYFTNNSTLLIDIQQWIISLLKPAKQAYRQEIMDLFKFLNQSTCHLSFSMKQFLFDQLANLYFELTKQNKANLGTKQSIDFCDRIPLLPIIIECLSDTNLPNYQVPYHPSIIKTPNPNHVLIDLFFFYLQRSLLHGEIIKYELIHKILFYTLPPIVNKRLIPTVEKMFKQLKDYLILESIALVLCQTDLNHDEQKFDSIIKTIINQYLNIDEQLNKHFQHFLSRILIKRSWSFLLNLLKSERFQRLNAQWSNTLYSLLELKTNPQQNKSLQLCHQLDFTLTLDTNILIFPKLHQPYEELSKVMQQCVNNDDQEQRWKSLSDWIQLQLNANPVKLNKTEIKVLLLLNIYYDYYCNNQLRSLNNLLIIIENNLEVSSEELRVFRVFLRPEKYMVGYPNENNLIDNNCMNNSFKLDCNDEHDLNIRHCLVNLLAMILLGGKQNFLWTFTFEPLKLQDTFGFGSTRHELIQTAGAHYDCGCLLTANGELIQPVSTKGSGSALNIPAAYVAYFSTFGALTWHLLLFDKSVENLYGPILAKHAIDSTTVTGRIAGDTIRAKVCHFVRARSLSTYHFLSILSNEDDACVLLNRCFEKLAQLTNQDNQWIKPIYTNFEEKFHAEQAYQNKVFYSIHDQFIDYKKLINNLYLKSQIQKNLQDYILQMPMIIQFKHFKIELSNPKNTHLPLNILRNLIDSFDLLKITHFISDLTQFYLLLHRTYAYLIRRDEYLTITLYELYQRSQKSFQNNENLTIIENGIKAVNTYHQFSNGYIRPGACDETESFQTISMQTPVHYLITTENYDEGDIIMRILSVLIDHHNNILSLLRNEVDNNGETDGINLLKNLIDQLTSKEISIFQIAQDNTGIISLTDNDCLWIEQLSRASLQNNDEYFLTANTPYNFDFLYVQSYIIRSYLLLCRINYRNLSQKYPWHISPTSVNQTQTTAENISLDLEDQWKHLKEIDLDKLSNGYKLLQRIIDLIKSSTDTQTNEYLYEYLQKIDDDQNEFFHQCQKYEIKNFPLNIINSILQIYENTLKHFQYSFINTSPILRVPIENNLNEELDQIFTREFHLLDDNQNKTNLQYKINQISNLLNNFKSSEDFLLTRSSQSLKQTCKDLFINDSITDLIPFNIKCQNYVELATKLIDMKQKLQEKTIHIEENDTKLWNIDFNDQISEQQNMYQLLKNPNIMLNFNQQLLIDLALPELEPLTNFSTNQDLLTDLMDFSEPIVSEIPLVPMNSQAKNFSEIIDYTSLFTLTIRSISSISSSNFFKQVLTSIESNSTSNRKPIVMIKHIDGTTRQYLCPMERLSEQFTKIFQDNKYDINQYVIIDADYLFVNFIQKAITYLSKEYRIVQKNLLIAVILDFQDKQFEYLGTNECLISSVIKRFIIDQQLRFSTDDIYLVCFDELGRYIDEDNQINNLYRLRSSNPIRIKVMQYQNNVNSFCEVILHSNENEQETKLFNPVTTWERIAIWLQIQRITVNTFHFWDRQHQMVLDKHQSISSTLNNSSSITIDGIDEDSVMDIILSYGNNQQITSTLKSCPVHYLFHHPEYLKKLTCQISPNDCTLILIEDNNQRILTNQDLQQSLGSYVSLNNQTLHFEITILIELIQFDTEQELKIPIPNRNLSIEQLLKLVDNNSIYQYIASFDTHFIFSNDEQLSNINQNKFLLVKENQTCMISIEQTNDILLDINDYQIINQRYTINSTIAHLYKQNKFIFQDQYFVYENDFIPSEHILLSSLLQIRSPIKFTLTNQKFPTHIIVVNEEENRSIDFYCLPSISIERRCQIACQLFNLNSKHYRLTSMDDKNIDHLNEWIDNIQLKLKLTADVQCQIKYEENTILLPANNDTNASDLVKEALGRFSIINDDLDKYKLLLVIDPESPAEINFSTSIEDIRACCSDDLRIIPLQLQKTQT